jgi:hypothetical protein
MQAPTFATRSSGQASSMSGVGPERHLLGFSGIEDEVSDDHADRWVVERRGGDDWTVVRHYASEQAALDALDELSGSLEINLSELRVRELD